MELPPKHQVLRRRATPDLGLKPSVWRKQRCRGRLSSSLDHLHSPPGMEGIRGESHSKEAGGWGRNLGCTPILSALSAFWVSSSAVLGSPPHTYSRPSSPAGSEGGYPCPTSSVLSKDCVHSRQAMKSTTGKTSKRALAPLDAGTPAPEAWQKHPAWVPWHPYSYPLAASCQN